MSPLIQDTVNFICMIVAAVPNNPLVGLVQLSDQLRVFLKCCTYKSPTKNFIALKQSHLLPRGDKRSVESKVVIQIMVQRSSFTMKFFTFYESNMGWGGV